MRGARALFAEALGTSLLVLIGVGTAVLAGHGVGTIGIALAFGLTLLALAYALAPVSGCHLNPAVTLGLLLARKISPDVAARYVGAQVVGGVIGAAAVLAIAAGRPGYSLGRDGLGTNGWGGSSAGGYGLVPVAVTEVLATFVLVFVVLAVTDEMSQTQFAGIPIGVTLVVLHLLAIGIDGTSVNPARSLGPALLRGGQPLAQVWAFLVFPLVGGALAAFVHRALFGGQQVDNRSSAVESDGEGAGARHATAPHGR